MKKQTAFTQVKVADVKDNDFMNLVVEVLARQFPKHKDIGIVRTHKTKQEYTLYVNVASDEVFTAMDATLMIAAIRTVQATYDALKEGVVSSGILMIAKIESK